MYQVLPPPPARGLFASIGAGLGFLARLLIGAMVIFVASFVAMMTAFAGLMLAGAALMMRYVALRQPARVPVRVKDSPATLQARRSPRGWTVE